MLRTSQRGQLNVRANQLTDWLGRRLMDDAGVWPWAEHNQGFLSLLALVLALAIAVFEVRRAAWSARRELGDQVDYVLAIGKRAIENTRAAIKALEAGVAVLNVLDEYNRQQQSVQATLKVIARSQPRNPRLAVSTAFLERSVGAKIEFELRLGAPTPIEALKSRLRLLETVEERIRGHKPVTGWNAIRTRFVALNRFRALGKAG
jgi:hypothetical protein